MRLGILGGTFDPIHFGHLLAAETAREQLRLDRVVFAPAAQPPHKQGQPISPIEHRVAMVWLAIVNNLYFLLSLVDVERPGPHYTLDTVRLLRAEYAIDAEETYLVIGADSLTQLPTWHEPRQLIRLCRLAVVTRPHHLVDMAALEHDLPGITERVDWVEMPALDIASSDLQRRVRAGRSIRYQAPEAVMRYIAEHCLYRSDP
ncbi:MAG: nicotinic acid mononucleotide adenylyltransferase [Ardenticatenia bacterium]|jgi:nicotinate-nucleotide adenylyltransferase|nr:MAG: nicotinic acid mononucleotide adenylyltransferase [Ardenticatenia bacterium]